jgi:hypothetical protein
MSENKHKFGGRKKIYLSDLPDYLKEAKDNLAFQTFLEAKGLELVDEEGTKMTCECNKKKAKKNTKKSIVAKLMEATEPEDDHKTADSVVDGNAVDSMSPIVADKNNLEGVDMDTEIPPSDEASEKEEEMEEEQEEEKEEEKEEIAKAEAILAGIEELLAHETSELVKEEDKDEEESLPEEDVEIEDGTEGEKEISSEDEELVTEDGEESMTEGAEEGDEEVVSVEDTDDEPSSEEVDELEQESEEIRLLRTAADAIKAYIELERGEAEFDLDLSSEEEEASTEEEMDTVDDKEEEGMATLEEARAMRIRRLKESRMRELAREYRRRLSRDSRTDEEEDELWEARQRLHEARRRRLAEARRRQLLEARRKEDEENEWKTEPDEEEEEENEWRTEPREERGPSLRENLLRIRRAQRLHEHRLRVLEAKKRTLLKTASFKGSKGNAGTIARPVKLHKSSILAKRRKF